MNEAVKIGSYEDDDDYGNDPRTFDKVRDGMDPHTFFDLYGDNRTLDQCIQYKLCDP